MVFASLVLFSFARDVGFIFLIVMLLLLFFFFFCIIKNLFPKGQCPTNNQQLQKAGSQRNRKMDSTSPIDIGKGASARYENNVSQ